VLQIDVVDGVGADFKSAGGHLPEIPFVRFSNWNGLFSGRARKRGCADEPGTHERRSRKAASPHNRPSVLVYVAVAVVKVDGYGGRRHGILSRMCRTMLSLDIGWYHRGDHQHMPGKPFAVGCERVVHSAMSFTR